MISRVCLVLVLVSSASLLAAADDPYATPIPILKDDRTQDAYGGYTFDFESGNGIVRQESGKESDGQAKEGGWRDPAINEATDTMINGVRECFSLAYFRPKRSLESPGTS
ncbi:uncharacterized protein LOC125038620 [Penaeus chinensis]|uniref:uncharacterized protein LOC125038620 n=1 Tax=Penaeus chinensis TaxID=139456 RepID=UPI001FB6D8CC|nr:uncharacterized protein LOC125038620 [Penaeus chinensis]